MIHGTSSEPDLNEIDYRIEPDVSDRSLNDLFASAWKDHAERKFESVLGRSLTYICAFEGLLLVGFVNVAWDGGIHGFILDTTVRRDYQRKGIGTELMRRAAKIAAIRGIEWLHVDYEPYLETFYTGCGYRRTAAGLLNLRDRDVSSFR
jgi:GNAT superfamily N-acetyltransferase